MEVPHNDALVITVLIDTSSVKQILVDPGISSEIMSYSLFQQHKLFGSQIRKDDTPIVGFNRRHC